MMRSSINAARSLPRSLPLLRTPLLRTPLTRFAQHSARQGPTASPPLNSLVWAAGATATAFTFAACAATAAASDGDGITANRILAEKHRVCLCAWPICYGQCCTVDWMSPPTLTLRLGSATRR